MLVSCRQTTTGLSFGSRQVLLDLHGQNEIYGFRRKTHIRCVRVAFQLASFARELKVEAFCNYSFWLRCEEQVAGAKAAGARGPVSTPLEVPGT